MKDNKIRKSDEYITYRVVLAFFEAAVFLLLMSKLQTAIDTPTTMDQARLVCLIIAIAAGACAVFGIGGYIRSVKKKTYKAGRVFNGMFLAMAALVVAISALLLYFNHILGMRIIYVFIPASAILFLIYSVYPKPLFITTATHMYVAFALYVLYKLNELEYRVFSAASALAVCAAAVILYFVTAKSKGCISIFGVNMVLFGRNANRGYLLCLYGITAVVIIASYAIGGFVALASMIAAIVFLVCSVVYGTVQMMR